MKKNEVSKADGRLNCEGIGSAGKAGGCHRTDHVARTSGPHRILRWKVYNSLWETGRTAVNGTSERPDLPEPGPPNGLN